jgi:hypothetical protein
VLQQGSQQVLQVLQQVLQPPQLAHGAAATGAGAAGAAVVAPAGITAGAGVVAATACPQQLLQLLQQVLQR